MAKRLKFKLCSQKFNLNSQKVNKKTNNVEFIFYIKGKNNLEKKIIKNFDYFYYFDQNSFLNYLINFIVEPDTKSIRSKNHNWHTAEDCIDKYDNPMFSSYVFKYRGKLLHREDGPTVSVTIANNDFLKTKYKRDFYIKDGILYRVAKYENLKDDKTKKRKWRLVSNSFYKNNILHRDGDLPTIILNDDDEVIKKWYKDGLLHREGGPAVQYGASRALWYKEGKIHRENGPAILEILPNGTLQQEWLIHDRYHRDDGPARIFEKKEEWWINGKVHREDGPAVIYKENSSQRGLTKWYKGGKLHRLDGLAIEWIDDEHIHKLGDDVEFTTGGHLTISDESPYHSESYYVEGIFFPTKIYKKIRYASSENLVEFLLDNNNATRSLAQFRLKELES